MKLLLLLLLSVAASLAAAAQPSGPAPATMIVARDPRRGLLGMFGGRQNTQDAIRRPNGRQRTQDAIRRPNAGAGGRRQNMSSDVPAQSGRPNFNSRREQRQREREARRERQMQQEQGRDGPLAGQDQAGGAGNDRMAMMSQLGMTAMMMGPSMMPGMGSASTSPPPSAPSQSTGQSTVQKRGRHSYSRVPKDWVEGFGGHNAGRPRDAGRKPLDKIDGRPIRSRPTLRQHLDRARQEEQRQDKWASVGRHPANDDEKETSPLLRRPRV